RPIGILSATFSVISAVISAISFIVVLATLSPLAPVIILLASVPGAVVTCLYRNRNFRYMRRHSKERRQMNYYSGILVNKDLAKEVKILDLGDTVTDKYRSVFARYFAGLKRLIYKEGITEMLVGLLSVCVHCLLFFYVAYHVVRGEGQIGDYTLYTGALSSIAGYVTTLVSSTAKIYEGTLFIDNMIDFMKEKSYITPTATPPLLPEAGRDHTLELSHVSFRYPGSDRDVLTDVSLTLHSGEHAVLVGLNGAGKTTLIKLLTRLYDPTAGVILLDGKDIRTYDVKAYHNLFGIIFQDFGKYAESAAENIRFGDVALPPDDARIHAAAEASDADAFLQKLPEGYDTPLTRMFEEDGVELSGGQWQKLSIARAFYKKGDILILDEPTASLDPLAEQAVFRRFEELSRGKIAIYVSHRLSSAVSASKIVLLDGGVVAECGTHEELMRLGGKYATEFSVQAERYGVGGEAAQYAKRYFDELEEHEEKRE
ncbi:MAG TPA: ABC transporter permease, partial [Clostridiales bacterium]|nr:ABC transporter permease [Clostridiales bacterium]